MPTVFADVILANSVLASGVRGKNMRKNDRVPVDNGVENVNIIWNQTLRQFEFGTVPLLKSHWLELESLHEVTDGGAYGFLLEDPKDNYAATGVVATVSSGVYQLYNRRIHAGSGRYRDRKITRPRATGFVLLSNGVPVSGGSYTLDTTTGQVTTGVSGTLTWTGYFYNPVHFVDDSIDWSLVVPGSMDSRYWIGPSVLMQEIRE